MARAAAKFMEVVTDELLTEILLRLPDARSVIQTSLVCKRWNSLLLKDNDGTYFKTSFVEFHQNTPKSSELLFNVSELVEGDIHRISLTLPSKSETVPCDLSFVPPSTRDSVVMLASCDDLALLSRGRGRSGKLFVCNLLTKQSALVSQSNYALWESSGSWGHAIAFNQRSYKVVVVYLAYFSTDGHYKFRTDTFHPETGEWRLSGFTCPAAHPPTQNLDILSRLQIVVVRGVLYWLAGVEKAYSLASLDPFGIGEGRLIPLPDRFRNIDIGMRGFKDSFRLGALSGRLRMSQLTKHSDNDGSRRFELLIWELNSDDSSWVLVHEAALENDATESLFFVLAFHPSDGNVIFLVRGSEIFRYNICIDEYERVSTFPAPNGCEFNKENVSKYLNVLSVVHPTWPTPPTSVIQTA